MSIQSRVDNYNIIQTLGSGATCKVKHVVDLNTGVNYALKLLKSSNQQEKDYFAQFIRTETAAYSRVNHPNVVGVIHSNENGIYYKKNGEIYDCMYLVMEHCTNGNLFDIVFHTGRINEAFTRSLFRQIIDGLEACHNAGFAHRDMKPQNILLDDKFNVKIADLGFAIDLAGHDGTGNLHSYKGTEIYMAPEIMQQQPYNGQQVDVFSTGVVLFIIYSQNPPFMRANQYDQLFRMFNNEPDKFWKVHERKQGQGYYNQDFQHLINGMLSNNPQTRLTIQQIKESPWYAQQSADAMLLYAELIVRRNEIIQAAELERQQRMQQNQCISFSNGRYYRGDSLFSISSSLSISFNDDFRIENLPKKTFSGKFNQILTGCSLSEVQQILSHHLDVKGCEIEECGTKFYGRKFTDIGELEFVIKFFDAKDQLILIEFNQVCGSTFDLIQLLNSLQAIFRQLQEV